METDLVPSLTLAGFSSNSLFKLGLSSSSTTRNVSQQDVSDGSKGAQTNAFSHDEVIESDPKRLRTQSPLSFPTSMILSLLPFFLN
jgi:hypothetical protein